MTELLCGLLVDDSAISLAVQLEARGHRLSSDRGVLKVSDGARLSAEDIAAIRRLRHHLIAIAVYPEMGNTWLSEAPTVSVEPVSFTAPRTSTGTTSISKTATSLSSKTAVSRKKKTAHAFDWDTAAAR